MKTATSKQIKDELKQRPREELAGLLQRLLRFKKENKELVNYLLFYENDEYGFIQDVKQDMKEGFATVNVSSFYLAKKTVRKVLRMMNKYIRHSGVETTKVELILYFCGLLKDMDMDITQNKVLTNMYDRQMLIARKTLLLVHEDLRLDFKTDFDRLA
jgi:hypothetical protein